MRLKAAFVLLPFNFFVDGINGENNASIVVECRTFNACPFTSSYSAAV